jgi:predicted nucleotidyltransferase
MTAPGSAAHQALIARVTAHYREDPRVLAVVVFGSLSTGTWHELSDVDLDVVVADGVTIDPAAETRAIFGAEAAIVIGHGDSADVVLDSGAELSVRWHPLRATSPNITAGLTVAAGRLSAAEITAAGEANRTPPDVPRLLDTLVREAVGAWKFHQRGRYWEAIAAVERTRHALTALRGRRDQLKIDPAEPMAALAAVITEASASYDLGEPRRAILARLALAKSASER